MKDRRERRVFPLTEVRADGEGDGKVLKGHAAVFNQETDIGGGWYREKISSGAFKESLKKDDIRALWNHNTDAVLGRKAAGTLRLEEDDKGLAVEIDVPDTQWGRDAIISIGRKDVTQMSFAFDVLTDEWNKQDGVRMRTLRKLKLYEVSPVAFPAYTQTDIGLRSVSAELGVDLDQLAGILFCHAQGLELDAEGRELVERARGRLEQVLRAPGYGLELLRARMDIEAEL